MLPVSRPSLRRTVAPSIVSRSVGLASYPMKVQEPASFTSQSTALPPAGGLPKAFKRSLWVLALLLAAPLLDPSAYVFNFRSQQQKQDTSLSLKSSPKEQATIRKRLAEMLQNRGYPVTEEWKNFKRGVQPFLKEVVGCDKVLEQVFQTSFPVLKQNCTASTRFDICDEKTGKPLFHICKILCKDKVGEAKTKYFVMSPACFAAYPGCESFIPAGKLSIQMKA